MHSKSFAAVALAVLWFTGSGAASALDTPYECSASDATYFVGYEDGNDEFVFVSTRFAPPLDHKQMEFALRATPAGSGFRFANDFAEFRGKGHEAFLHIDGRPVPCVPQATNLRGTSHSDPADAFQQIAAPGRSLGGNVRSGPGTRFADIGSLPEGAPIIIESNAAARFNGYDWFEISAGGLRGFQWGGIMCSEGRMIEGLYQQCGATPPQPAASGAGWMAFAIDGRGAVGHGSAPTRAGAERFALQYCGNTGCRVADVTQNQCHALADAAVDGGYWYGVADADGMAQSEAEALERCGIAPDASACGVRYSFCR